MASNNDGRVLFSQAPGVTNAVVTAGLDTYVPRLTADANIQEALRMFYLGTAVDNATPDTTSLYTNLLNMKTNITTLTTNLSSHTGNTTTAHGVTGAVMGTTSSQEVSNKTFTTGNTISTGNTFINSGTFSNTGTISSTSGTIVLGTNANAITANSLTISATEIGYLDNLTSNIQTQLNGKLGSTSQAVDSNKLNGRIFMVQTTQPSTRPDGSALAVGDVWISY